MTNNASTKVRVVTSEDDARQCWPACRELRPHLCEDEFIRRWQKQSEEGYVLLYVQQGRSVPAAAGYRLMHTMAWGRILYLDDLVTVEGSRQRGLGTLLLT